ncbi:hypothetical protein [Krasilnikovia sp. MM14-A1004]|uniref:hypothetical protein n=1 Tax=Krasilnikovia sp. MM14-A1004 TaxID=3373541 RepID=UPI00399D20AC
MAVLTAKTHKDDSESLATRLLQYYPITGMALLPYLALIIPQAAYYHNPEVWVIVRIVGLAFAGSALIETAALPIRKPYPHREARKAANSRYPRILRVARPLAIASMAIDITSAAAGGGTIFTQVSGQAAVSPIVTLTTPFNGWRYVAAALFVSAYFGGYATKATFYRWMAAMFGAQLVIAAYTARAAPIAGFISFAIMGALMCGLVRVRSAAIIGFILLLAWPAIFAARNEIRERGGVAVPDQITAENRIRLDEQVSRVGRYAVPVEIQDMPGPAEVIRYGAVPRFLDPDRPLLSTGGLINEAMGGGRTSAYTFLLIGTVYFLHGPSGVVAYFAAWAVFFVLLLRTGKGPGPGRLAMIFLAITGPFGWIATYPDVLIGYVQNLVAAVPVLFGLHIVARRTGKSPGVAETSAPPLTAGIRRQVGVGH